MAQSGGVGSMLKWALLAGGGFLVYRVMTGSGTTASAAASSSGSLTLDDLIAAIRGAGAAAANPPASSSSPAPVQPAPADMVTALKSAASAAGNTGDTMNQDQWNFYRNQLWPPALTGAQFVTAFPNGSEQLTAEEFVAGLHAAGLAGLGGLGGLRIPVPVVMRQNGRPVVVWSSRELPGSGPARVAVFSAAHPFMIGARPLPARVAWGSK